MPQYRKLYTKSTESLDINDMPDDFTRLLWVLLPLGLCREGRGLDNPEWIKAKIFPLRSDVTPELVKSSFGWYQERGMIERYESDGRCYFRIVSWSKYQGNTSKEAPSPYPSPTNSGVSQELVKSKSATDTNTNTNTNADTNTNAGGGSSSDNFALVIKAYENNIGGLTKRLSDFIGEAVDTYPLDWIIDAIDIAVRNNAHKWNYIEGVLKNWQTKGRGYSPGASANGQTPQVAAPSQGLVEIEPGLY